MSVMTKVSVSPYLPTSNVLLGEDIERVEELVRKINAYLGEHFNWRVQNAVFVPLTPSLPARKLKEEEHLTKYPFGEPLNGPQLALLREVYKEGWVIRPLYSSLVKHQLVFVPLNK